MKKLTERLKAHDRMASVQRHRYHLPRRLLFAVNHSFPFSSNGYAVHTHGVAARLVRTGCNVVVVPRPSMPWNQPQFANNDMALHHVIDGVRYILSRSPSRANGFGCIS